MGTTANKKRKIIDLDERTFKILSVKAASTGTNLKSLIEKTLTSVAENIEEAELYSFLVKSDLEGKEYLNPEEKKGFENWLGI